MKYKLILHTLALATLTLTLALALAAPAAAQQSPKRKVVRLDEITLEGRIQKPQAFYILQRSNLSYENSPKVQTFLDKIPETVTKEPF